MCTRLPARWSRAARSWFPRPCRAGAPTWRSCRRAKTSPSPSADRTQFRAIPVTHDGQTLRCRRAFDSARSGSARMSVASRPPSGAAQLLTLGDVRHRRHQSEDPTFYQVGSVITSNVATASVFTNTVALQVVSRAMSRTVSRHEPCHTDATRHGLRKELPRTTALNQSGHVARTSRPRRPANTLQEI